MSKALPCLALALCATVFPFSAWSQSITDNHTQELLLRLQQLSAPSTTRSPADLSGIVTFNIYITLPQGPDFTGGLFCHAGMSQFNFSGGSSFSSGHDIPATLKSSRHYKCVVAVPYHWNGADTANVMQLNITVFSMQVNHTLGDTNVSTTVNPPGIPMPADGAVTALTVDVDM